MDITGGTNIIIFDIEGAPQQESQRAKQQDLVEELLANKYASADSTIPSILLKLVLEYCMPIIEAIPKVVISGRDIEKRANIKVESKTEIERGISIIFDRDIVCQYKTSKIKIAAGQMVVVVGLIVPTQIRSNQWLTVYDYMASNAKYPIKTILRSGLYCSFNCYKNYFFNAYLERPIMTGEKQIQFSAKLADNNAKILRLLAMCRALYEKTSLYLLTVHSAATNRKPTPISNRLGNVMSNEQKITEWLVKSKLATPQQLRYLQTGIKFNQLVDKIEWHGGPNDSNAAPYVEQLKLLIAAGQSANNERIQHHQQYIEIARKQTIAFNKFGTSDIFGLTAAQQKHISQEYKQSLDRAGDIIVSPIIQALTAAIDSGDKKELTKALSGALGAIGKSEASKFEKQLNAAETTLTAQFSLKDNSVLCPHILEQATRMKDTLDTQNWILNKYGAQGIASKGASADTYCKICGALLAEYDEEDIAYKERDNYVMSFEDDELFSMVKRELQYVLSYYTQQPPAAPISVSKIVDLLAGIIRAKLLEIQGDLIKIKTLGDNDMWLLINVYIYIYIFAILTQFVFANPDILQFKQAGPVQQSKFNKFAKSAGGKVNIANSSKEILTQLLKHKQGKDSLERLINYALELIKKLKYGDIVNSKYITMANIKELFLAAYKWTMSLNYNVESIEDFAGKQNTELKQTDIEQYSLVELFSQYGKLGRTYAEIESQFAKGEPVYKTVNLAKDAPHSMQLLRDYVVGEQYFMKPVPENPTLNKIIAAFMAERANEQMANRQYVISHMRPFGQYPMYQINNYKLDLPFALVGNCGKGCAQTYIYRPANKKGNVGLKEYTQKEITDWLTSKNEAKLRELYSMECLGMKCVCKEPKNPQVVLFYKYFEQYCPKGELHEYAEKKCKKCGITDEIIKDLDKGFYDKYKDVFAKTRRQETAITNQQMAERVAQENDTRQNKSAKRQNKAKFPDWQPTTKEITDLAKRVNIKNLFNIFSSIGFYEGQSFAKIEANQVQPYLNASDEGYMIQALACHNYILLITRNYNLTRSSEYMTKVPVDIKNLLTKAGQNNKDFAKKMADLDQSYIGQFDWYSGQKIAPAALANFCLVHLAKLFLVIDDVFKKAKLDKFGGMWVQFYISKIIGFEKIGCTLALKHLKPLQRYEELEDEKNDVEDGDAVGDFEVQSVDEEHAEDIEINGDDFANDENVDLGEEEADELNMDNSFVTVEN